MQELIAAAKAVIEELDEKDTWVLSVDNEDRLRAAVDRAEKQEAVGFDEWMKAYMDDGPDFPPSAIHGWRAGQQAERERCREIVITIGGPDVPDLLRQIDSGEE